MTRGSTHLWYSRESHCGEKGDQYGVYTHYMGTRSHPSLSFSPATLMAKKTFHPWLFLRGRPCQKKTFQPDSSSKLNRRDGWMRRRWVSGSEKSTLRDRVAFSTQLRLYWSTTPCAPISPMFSKNKWSKLIRCLPSFRVD